MLATTDPKPLRWQRAQDSPLARQREVFAAALGFAITLWWDSLWQRDSPDLRRRRAAALVNTLLDLGPTFIKIGQSLSTRVDLLPTEYVREFSKLQDRVPAFSTDEAIAIIETELSKPLFELFRDFDREPLAAASLGQVHRARLHTGDEVAVKVQRPGLKRLFDLDARALARLIRFVTRFWPQTRKYQLDKVYDEFFHILYQEIDYTREGKHADRFRANFADTPRLIVPKVYWEYTATRVLTMAYVPGIKIDDRQALEACGLDPREINSFGIRAYLKQLLIDGFFHADPHPGNLAVSQAGDLIFYDFGMMSEVLANDRGQMVRTFFAMLKKDTDTVIDTLTTMGLLDPSSDMAPVRRLVATALDRFTEKPLDMRAMKEIKGEIVAAFEAQPFRLPAKMTYLLKCLSTLGGIALILDPEYNFKAAAQPFMRSLALAQAKGGAIGELARQAKDLVVGQLSKPSGMEVTLRRLEERLERGELRLQVKSAESDRALRRIDLGVKALIYACVSGFSLLSGTVLLLGAFAAWAPLVFAIAGLSFVGLLRSLIRLSWRERLDRMA